ncbi:precorrin-2 dehydrogenase/sirohydrochlorin ferrochelatase family protein [Clostridium pasteurianum]|uniref:precorrin-2 dehydrogenase n=1 Tax=Clostridium pasteurianum BC1 TaxID=86416 RepID=R4K7C4_CLOPA|nr:bifunctional precorrin-2 dehydrogenase/sirohydrochlorin ferrochelatase [Clostridium pasteurianum]AGK99072.1 siroheme synthase, N-terminal domain protein [Clostridium pasteurianum BC1]
MNEYYPIMLNVKSKKCGVIGGGKVAYRKITALLECGAEVLVISREIIQDIEILVNENKVIYLEDNYDFKYISDLYLVYAATNEKNINNKIYKQCNEKNILVNVVDEPDICNFIVPSKIRRGDLTIAVSTNGKSPMLAKKIREDLEEIYDDRYEIFLDIMGQIRKEAFAILKDSKRRSEFYRHVIYSNFINRLSYDNKESIQKEIMDILIEYKSNGKL